jgi:hypothetical protein
MLTRESRVREPGAANPGMLIADADSGNLSFRR